jgi:hypothetical protein
MHARVHIPCVRVCTSHACAHPMHPPHLYRCALHSRMPSMIDAWLSSSLMTASSAVRRASKRPACLGLVRCVRGRARGAVGGHRCVLSDGNAFNHARGSGDATARDPVSTS